MHEYMYILKYKVKVCHVLQVWVWFDYVKWRANHIELEELII